MVEILTALAPVLELAIREGLRAALPKADDALRTAAAGRMTAVALEALRDGDLETLLGQELVEVRPLDLDKELPR